MKRTARIVKHTVAQWLMVACLLVGPVVLAVPAASAASESHTAACNQINMIDASQDCSTKGSGFLRVIGDVVNILSIIAGIIAIIMIINAGLKFLTSGGDSNKLGAAKSALIYALIGLAVAGLAQVLVHYVINTANKTATECPTDKRYSISSPQCKSP